MSDTASDELAGILRRRIGGPVGETVADILAAGYRKPRTITTVEELDALRVGSVVLSEGYGHHANQMLISFQRWWDGEWHRGARAGSTHPDNFLPATVLHEPAEASL